MSIINDMHEDWKAVLNAQTVKKQALEKERKPLQDELDAFDKGAPTGLWGRLKHQMAKNVGLSPTRDKIGKLDTRIGNAHFVITQKAKETYDYIADYAMSMPAAAPLRAAKADEERLVRVLTIGYEATVETIKACEDAAAQEWTDLRADSVQQQASSFRATKHAKQMLAEIGGTLGAMSKQAGDLKLSLQTGAESSFQYLSFEQNLAQAMYPTSSLSPNDLNKMNALGLTQAANSLKTTENSLKSAIDQLKREIQSATGKAIGIARGADPEMDKLAAAITPYLPGELASNMSRRAAPAQPPRP
jgi:hypothetical protein